MNEYYDLSKAYDDYTKKKCRQIRKAKSAERQRIFLSERRKELEKIKIALKKDALKNGYTEREIYEYYPLLNRMSDEELREHFNRRINGY